MTRVEQLQRSGGLTAPATVGAAALGVSTVLIVLLHALGAGQVDPMRETVSDYAFVPGGWLLGIAALGLAVAGGAAMLGFARAGLLRAVPTRIAFGVQLAGDVLVGVFPTDEGAVKTWTAYVHQYAAGLLLFGVPSVALCTTAALARAGRMPRTAARLRRCVALIAVTLAFFLSAHFAVMPEFTRHVLGLAERVLFALEVLLLARLVSLPARYARGLP